VNYILTQEELDDLKNPKMTTDVRAFIDAYIQWQEKRYRNLIESLRLPPFEIERAMREFRQENLKLSEPKWEDFLRPKSQKPSDE